MQLRYQHKDYSIADFVTKFSYHPEPWLSEIAQFLTNWTRQSTFTLYTSGSTGQPKSIMVTKEAMLASAKQTLDYIKPIAHDFLLALPAQFVGGKMMLVRSIVHGARLWLIPPQSSPNLNEITAEIGLAAFTPSQFKAMQKNVNPSKIAQLQNVLLGGEAVTIALEAQLKGSSTRFFETYGMTETISHIALRLLNQENDFTAFSGIDIGTDHRDCLWIEAPYLTERIQTNDVVVLNGQDRFKVLGRADEVINSGGVKLHPSTLEQKLQAHISFPYLIVAVPHPQYHQRPALLICTNALSQALINAVENCLSGIEKPDEMFALKQFVYTESGKLNRLATASLLQQADNILARHKLR